MATVRQYPTVGDAAYLHRSECYRSNPDAPRLSTACTCSGKPRWGGTW